MNSKGNSPNINLLLLLLGRMISDIGSSIQMMIMPLFIIDIGGDGALLGLFAFLSLVPILITYPFGGVFGDRLNRKRIMVFADLISGTLVLILALISSLNMMNIIVLFGIQVLISLAYGFFDPASKGMVPQLVGKEKLAQTNSKIATLRIMSGIAAPLVAVVLYTTYGIALLFIINGLSFLISGISESFIKYKHIPKKETGKFSSVFHDLSMGVRFIVNHHLIKNMSVFFLMTFALIQPVFTVILPLFFRTRLAYTDTQYGVIQVVLFIGALLGSILVGFISKRGELRKPFVMGLTALFIFMLIFSGTLFPGILSWLGNNSLSYLVLFASIIFMLYTSIMFIAVPIQTIIQKSTPEEYMSRVFSIVGLITKGGMPLGALIYGIILKSMPIHIVASLAAVIIAALSIIFLSSNTINRIKDVEEIKSEPIRRKR